MSLGEVTDWWSVPSGPSITRQLFGQKHVALSPGVRETDEQLQHRCEALEGWLRDNIVNDPNEVRPLHVLHGVYYFIIYIYIYLGGGGGRGWLAWLVIMFYCFECMFYNKRAQLSTLFFSVMNAGAISLFPFLFSNNQTPKGNGSGWALLFLESSIG